jgi:hypothetical protein
MNDAILSDTIPGDSAELVNALAERGHENRAFK